MFLCHGKESKISLAGKRFIAKEKTYDSLAYRFLLCPTNIAPNHPNPRLRSARIASTIGPAWVLTRRQDRCRSNPPRRPFDWMTIRSPLEKQRRRVFTDSSDIDLSPRHHVEDFLCKKKPPSRAVFLLLNVYYVLLLGLSVEADLSLG
jgi:hypothetical protein